MANLKSDSPVCRRIVLAFLDFLKSVEPAPGVDLEGLEVVRECLEEAFKLNPSSTDDQIQPGLLVNLFNSMDENKHLEFKLDQDHSAIPLDTPSTSSAPNAADVHIPEASKPLKKALTGEPDSFGISKDELFGQFFSALEKIRFFKTTPDGGDDQVQLDRATRMFHDALEEMERAGCQIVNQKTLAETLKSQGNRAMQSNSYSEAIELYTCAIALSENAVYYCNRFNKFNNIFFIFGGKENQ
uniref:Uncharacterized protein n=1 Tax=Nelumbo nucifera TaxID=4432 RepID=A0A822XZF6_NELNU|nr:TPA_asm: hypothetical protein HUJ06_026065 [Nelumbo nucifera]